MALLAVKHLDPVVGVDVHSVLVTPGTPPVFLPHPHVGFMLDLREYIQAAKAVVGCIAMMIVQEKVTEYIEDHPEDVTKLEHLADEASQQVNELIGDGKIPDLKDDPTVAEGMKLAKAANRIKNRISDDLGSNVGSGGGSGRPIFVNGMMRATAGTHAYHVPGLHFPLGESFAPPPEEVEPSNDGESFMGSKTVLANNDPMSYMALEALSCWSVGMEPPPHNSAHTDRTYPSMPSSVMLPIPAGRPVLVGGPPIVNMVAAAKGLFKSFRGSKWAKALADKLNLKSGFLRCKVLHAEPVDAITGEVVVEQHDFTIPGRLPLIWTRHYRSQNTHRGTVGVGWQTPADIRLELIWNGDEIGAVVYFPDHASAFDRIPEKSGWHARMHDWQRGHEIYNRNERLILRTRHSIEYDFVLPENWRQSMDHPSRTNKLVMPITRMGDLNGNAWEFQRDNEHHLSRIIESNNAKASGRKIECHPKYPAANQCEHGYPHIISELIFIDSNNRPFPLSKYEHDSNANLVAVFDSMGLPHRFSYMKEHLMISHTSARGVTFRYLHGKFDDGIWRVERAWGDEGFFDYNFKYNILRHETTITNSLGFSSTLVANDRGMPINKIDPLGGVTTYRYDPQGRACEEIDPGDRKITWEYDVRGNLRTHILPDGRTTTSVYDEYSRPVIITLPGEREWQYKWDSQGNLVEQISPSQAVSHFEYDRYGQVIAHSDPRGATTKFRYDSNGNVNQVIDPRGSGTHFQHDARGNVVQVIDPFGHITNYEYDLAGHVVRLREPGGYECNYSYDADGNLVRANETNGKTVDFEYSMLGQVRKRTSSNGDSIEYLYDTEERLIGVVNERGENYRLELDALDRVIAEVDYWGATRRYFYGASGQILMSNDPLGRAIIYDTDLGGRIVKKYVQDTHNPDLNHCTEYTYDQCDNLTSAISENIKIELTYDKGDRITTEKQGDDFLISHSYDAAGNCVERRTTTSKKERSASHSFNYNHDENNSVTAISIDGIHHIHIERDAIGNICCKNFCTALRHQLSYTSDGLLALQSLNNNATSLLESHYTYDVQGKLIEKYNSRTGRDYFGYDLAGRLISHTEPSGAVHQFSIDSAGDIIKTRYPKNPDQSIEDEAWLRTGNVDDSRYEFDRAGNIVRKQNAGTDIRLHWDTEGLLVETLCIKYDDALNTTNSLNQVTQTTYEYDPFRRRIAKHSKSQNFNSSPITGTNKSATMRHHRYMWDGDALIGELTSFETVDHFSHTINAITETREWLYLPGTFEILAATSHILHSDDSSLMTPEPAWSTKRGVGTGSNEVPPEEPRIDSAEGDPFGERSIGNPLQPWYFFYCDPNGAPVAVINISGSVLWEARYTAWGGAVVSGSSTSIGQPIRLQGQYLDDETGLHYTRHRYYWPELAAFVSQDPIGLGGGANLYRYTPDPNLYIDPLGLHFSGQDIINRDPTTKHILDVSGFILPSHRSKGTATNATSRKWARSLGLPTDDAGHTRANELGGSGGKKFVFPQAFHLNRGQFRVFESEIAKAVDDKWAVDFTQILKYLSHPTRPDEIRYSYTKSKCGLMVPVTRTFQNI
ncbi:RHS repeat-associated core domain-containing protein [Burkholderia contaminans]|nr:RHS repeat-associated core domain-containing protein [Burkholderia contaminans]